MLPHKVQQNFLQVGTAREIKQVPATKITKQNL